MLIVDDSRLFRAALEEALDGLPDITVVGSVYSGAKALEFIRNDPPDVVTLDVEMPGMDGLATLREIQEFNRSRPTLPAVGAILVSAFTRRGANVTIQALQAGAFDFVTKPSGPSSAQNLATLRDDVVPRIRACARPRLRGVPAVAAPPITRAPASVPRKTPIPTVVRVIAIASSTGGPRALSALLPELCSQDTAPILVVQHMPPDFTRSLAESLARQTQHKVVEAADGMTLADARVFIAPGGKHLVLRGAATAPLIGLSDSPPENGCRPSADVLFRAARRCSAATCWRSS